VKEQAQWKRDDFEALVRKKIKKIPKVAVRDLPNISSTHLCCCRAPMLLSTVGWLDHRLGWCHDVSSTPC
jgi:hypothetical protein